MSNERTDEFLAWRGRLDQPDALPQQGLDNHEASWQRLAERLGEKPRRRMTGYWVAAACLLLALIPAIRFLHPRSPVTAHRAVPVARPASARQQTLAEKVAAKPLPVGFPVSTPPVDNHQRSPSTRPTPHPAIAVPDMKPAADSHQLIIPRTELPLLVSDARASSPKKQLKVVYYNELSNPSGPSPSTAARTSGLLKFSIERFNSQAATGDPVAQPYNDPVLTIKLIPKNN